MYEKIAIVGSNGLLGNGIVRVFSEQGIKCYPITRQNYDEWRSGMFDVLINANGLSNRYLSNKNPVLGFEKSVVSVANTLKDFSFRKYVYISSSDVYGSRFGKEEADRIYPEVLEPYGLQKYMAELLVRNVCSEFLILRCSMILGRELKKGPVYDIINNNKLFVSKDTILQTITNTEIAKIILFLLDKDICNVVFNIGGHGGLTISEIEKAMGVFARTGANIVKRTHIMNINRLAKIFNIQTSHQYLKDFWEDYHARMDRSV